MQLSREQVAKLTDQELDTYARVVLNESGSRRAKLNRAKSYRGRQMIPALMVIFAIGYPWFSPTIGWMLFISLALLQWHSAGLNNRMDNLIELLDLDSMSECKISREDQDHQIDDSNQDEQADAGNRS
ncbi:MAG: hypothetical protein QM627_02705 [Luteolibacter sp.]